MMNAEAIYKAELERLMQLFKDGGWYQMAGDVAGVLSQVESMNDSKNN